MEIKFFSGASSVVINTWRNGSQIILDVIPFCFLFCFFLEQIAALCTSGFAYNLICALFAWEIFLQMKGALDKIDGLCQLSSWSCPS